MSTGMGSKVYNPATGFHDLILITLHTFVSQLIRLVRSPPAVQETPVQFLGWEDPLEKGKTTHSSILAWRIPWTV